MAGQMEFMDAVRELERIAETNGKQLTMEEIENYFADMRLDERQFDFICQYYESHNITIRDRVRRREDVLDEEIETKADPLDEEMVSIYMKETDGLIRLSPADMEQLAGRIINGDEHARSLLIEANLPFAAGIAGEYKEKGLPLSDLIQESNIGLMMAVNDYEPSMHGAFPAYAEQMIRSQIETALDEYSHSTRSAMKMANRVNELNDIATAYAREYEREARPQELAERMGISVEEVKELMKVSLDAIAILDGDKIGK